MLLETQRIVKLFKKGDERVHGVRLVSSGLLAGYDEVVDGQCWMLPKSFMWIADGNGDFIRQLSDSQLEILKVARECISGTAED